MVRILPVFLLFLFGCSNQVRVSGIVVDEQYGFPVKGVRVRTIVDIANREMKMAEAVTGSDGRFLLQFETFRTLPNEFPVELTKSGYLGNMYNMRIESQADTFRLVREGTYP